MRLIASSVTVGRTQKTRLDKQDATGNTVAFFVSTFADQNDLQKASRALVVPYPLLLDFVLNHIPRGIMTLDLATARLTTTFRVRNEAAADTTQCTDFIAALQAAATLDRGVIEWDATDAVCCLDIDFHCGTPPEHDLRMWAETVRPAPRWFWSSRSGALHAVFLAAQTNTADELAAVAAFAAMERFPLASFEFLHRTRKPPGTVFDRTEDADTGVVRRLLGQYTAGDFAPWLESRGFVGEQRYPHTMCPVDPSKAAEGNSPPVVVYDDNIYCFICAKNGTCRGSVTPGNFPLAVLSGERTASAVARCVVNMVHWGHAKHVVAPHVAPESLARRVYSALLKLHHGDDPRIPAAFSAGGANGLVRHSGYWSDAKGITVPLDAGSAILRSLPHCQHVTPTGEVETDAASVEWLSTTADHSCRGYIPLHTVRGIHLTQFQELPDTRVYITVQDDSIPEANQPRYLAPDKRMDLQEARGTLSTIFPGVDHTLLELIIAGRACAEHRAGLPPMLFLTGPTGAGKTGHAMIAAALLGDNFGMVTYNRDADRLRQGVMAAKQNAGVVMFDEYFKQARQAKVSDMEAMETLLTLTPESRSHMMYIGSVALGELPMFLWGDITMPLCIQQHEQIGRRMHHYRLQDSIEWELPSAAAGVTKFDMLRKTDNPKVSHACNTVLSHVMSCWFHEGVKATDFADVARDSGVRKLRDNDAVEDKYKLIRELFIAVCAAPDAEGSKVQRITHAKLVLCDPQDAIFPHLEALWLDHELRKAELSQVNEVDLKRVLNLKAQACFDIKAIGARFAVRFRALDKSLYNGELRA